MKVTTVTASLTRKFSLEQYGGPRYEYIEPSAFAAATVDEGEDPNVVLAQLRAIVRESVKEQAAPVLNHYRKQLEDIRASVPGLEEE